MFRRGFLKTLLLAIGGLFMSEGRIPISGLDIRHTAIKTTHLVDSSVTTPKIADVAVTVEKTDEPVWTEVISPSPLFNASLTTAPTEFLATTVDIPSWVGVVSIYTDAHCQISNSSGGVQGISVANMVNNLAITGGFTQDVANGGLGTSSSVGVTAISTPGATVEISLVLSVTTGTNSANVSRLRAILIGVR